MRRTGLHLEGAIQFAEVARTRLTLAVHQLLRDGVVGRAGAVTLQSLTVVEQSGGDQIGIVALQIVEQLGQSGAHSHAQLHPQIVGEAFSQFIIQPGERVAFALVTERRDDGTDAQLSTIENLL
ncbi:Uncharacterised protein [Edwardsiella tarda]|nr:Uncharacterised protein [Edwardsiella tarda]